MGTQAKYLIIGSGVAGFHALKELLNETGESIAMITDDRDYPYDRPPLSKQYLAGSMDREKVFFESSGFYNRPNLSIILGRSVVKIRASEGSVELSDGSTVGFEKALVATGGRPRRIEAPGALYLRTLRDADAIREAAARSRAVLIVGGGFIGVEAAASMRMRGLEATIIEARPHIMSMFMGDEVAIFMEKYLSRHGINIVTGDTL
ncbi:MAG: NAD(P)/FAD-dependent oxidoreductase, partial [Thermocladium sp.]